MCRIAGPIEDDSYGVAVSVSPSALVLTSRLVAQDHIRQAAPQRSQHAHGPASEEVGGGKQQAHAHDDDGVAPPPQNATPRTGTAVAGVGRTRTEV